jgi:ligand-binding sensor domain-containing protein/nitrogen-specific signal transduction histidine kinase
MDMYKAIKTTFFFYFFFFALAGVSVLSAKTLPLRHYSTDEGMADIFIKCIYQDSMGYIWFATRNGAVRFDGIEFRNYRTKDGLLADFILDIFEDRKGDIWIGTRTGGVSRFRAGQIKESYTLRGEFKDKGVISITEDREGFIWFGTGKGACKFDGEQYINYTPKNGLVSGTIFDMMTAKDGSIWFGTSDGVSRFINGHFENYTGAGGKPLKRACKLMEDSKGRIWICSETNGVFVFEKGKFLSFTMADGLASNVVLSVLEDHSGNIWLGTENGISIFSRGKFVNYTTKHGLLSNAILSLCEDREGNIWIGTNAGASCLMSLNIENYSVKDGLMHNMVYSIIEDRAGRCWMGTEDGLSCYSDGRFKTYTTREGLMDNRVYGLLEDGGGRIWIATYGGLSVYSAGKFTNYTKKQGLLSEAVESLCEDSKGIIWIGTLDGLNRFSNGKFSTFAFTDKVFGGGIKRILEDTKGNLWLSTLKGLYRISPAREKITHFTEKEGLPHSFILSMLEDSKGNIWIGTQEGLSCFKDEAFINYSTSDGLPHNKCYALVEDNRGNLWIGTARGLTRFNGKSFKTYTREDGFPTENWSDGGFFKDSKGNLWLGSVNGIARFNPETERINTVPPPVYITGVNVLERDAPLSEIHSLAYNQNYLKFKFAGICLSSPKSVVYHYRLEGIDKNWIETRERLVSYPYLPPGNYRFRVKAINNDGIESLKPAEVRFNISPPFWRTWWFTSILVIVFLSVLGLLVLWRVKGMKEKMAYEARTRQLVMAQHMELLGILAAGAVHDLKNLLAIILGYSKIAERSYDHHMDLEDVYKDRSKMPIEKIQKTAGTAIQVVKQILAFTRQKYDENAPAHLVDLLKDILDILNVIRPANVEIQWEPPEEDVLYRINPIRFQQLVMNLCLNAIQSMPRGGELKISLSKVSTSFQGTQIRLEISDTGIGIKEGDMEKIFDPLYTTREQGKGTGLGLFVVKQIVADHKGKIEVHSEPGKGTLFLITFDYKG